ncbi:MAG: hypothetical protein ABSF33_18580 [Acidimicrobiales bacterium]|jgi:hypothetical protein
MTDLDNAMADLDAAQAVHAARQVEANATAAHAAALRAQVASGTGLAVSASAIGEADDAALHAGLALQGAAVPLAGLAAAVTLAKSNAVCDGISETLPLLGRRMLDSLQAVEAALQEYTVAANVYDDFAANAVVNLDVTGLTSERISRPRYGVPSVDGLSIAPVHGDRLLASVTVKTYEALRSTPAFAIREQKLLASSAIPPVTN